MRQMGSDDYYYAWVINGCPNENGIEIIKNSISSKIEISTPVFKFTDYPEVYFHATVKACKDNDCVSTFLLFEYDSIDYDSRLFARRILNLDLMNSFRLEPIFCVD